MMKLLSTRAKSLGLSFSVYGGMFIPDTSIARPFYRFGLKANDILLDIDGVRLKDELSLVNATKAVANSKESIIELRVFRNGNIIEISVTLV